MIMARQELPSQDPVIRGGSYHVDSVFAKRIEFTRMPFLELLYR